MTKHTLFALLGATLLASPASGATLQFLVADQSADAVIFARDMNGDGDTNDAGEVQTFFDENNASGLALPTRNVFVLNQTSDGAVFLGDGTTDTVYRARDLNGNNTAQDAGEASVWFSADNASGLTLNTPNGIATGGDGAIYIVEADTVGTPSGDFIYRTEDLNGDGDANDAGEATVWFDINTVAPSVAPFEIQFDGDIAYLATTGGPTPEIFRIEDGNADGTIDAGEVTSFVSGPSAPFAFGIAVGAGGDVLALDILNDELRRLTDIDGSGLIDAPDENIRIWDAALAGAGSTFSLTSRDGDILVASNGGSSSPEEDAVFRLTDLDGNGDYLGAGETVSVFSLDQQGSLPIRARAAIFYDSVTAVPLPAGDLLLASGLVGLGCAVHRRRV
ncbi:MAG: VPLPA-CTERM sorting domain-containing protein [Pseudomonadota bacterium]